MNISTEKAKELAGRLLRSRMRILHDYGFFGLLLMHMVFNIDESLETAATDGERIFFNPTFLEGLSEEELDFIMMHEIMHIVLEHIFRYENREPDRFNIACNIVVDSNIMLERGMRKPFIIANFGPAIHLAPNGKEGYLYTAEQVYGMLPPQRNKRRKSADCFDVHDRWKDMDDGNDDRDFIQNVWLVRVRNAAMAIEIQNRSKHSTNGELMASRILKELRRSKINWREILINFIQDEICDYSFLPPDRRFDDADFFLPDFNEKDEKVKNIWFAVDTSGSVSDKDLAAAYSEIVSAIEQFNGRLDGMVSFFEERITDPVPFSTVEDIMAIKPIGGGGTNFANIFRYMNQNMKDELPSYLIIITDGYGKFPNEKEASGVPVLWLINNEEAQAPWGKVARISANSRSPRLFRVNPCISSKVPLSARH